MNIKKALFIIIIFCYAANTFGQGNLIQALDSGMARFKRNDFKGAIVSFTAAIKIDTTFPDLYYYRGLSEARFQDFNKAIPDFNKACLLYTSDAADE